MFEGLVPPKPLGESAFSGSAVNPNEVRSLFAQQKLMPALPVS